MKSAEVRNQNKNTKRIVGICLIVLSILCLLCGIFPSFLGIGNFFLGVFGILYYPLFLFANLVGTALCLKLKYNFDRRFTFYSLLSFFFLLCLLHTIFTSNLMFEKFTTFSDLTSYLSACFSMQYGVTIGGAVLGIIVFVLRALVGLGATYVIFSVFATLFIGLFIDYLIVRNNKNAKIKKNNKTAYISHRNHEDDVQKSILEETKYIEALDEKLNSSTALKSGEEEVKNTGFVQEDKEKKPYEFDETIGLNKTRENDEDYTAAYKTLFGDLSNENKQISGEEQEKVAEENVGPRSAKEVLFGDSPAVPNIFDRDSSERDAWRRQYSSNQFASNQSLDKQNGEEEKTEDNVFNNDDGLV
ncbi:MAG: hypothetical protein IJS74_01635, partial [Clostridia bacterium]|nr:hypothetical protein [Clostridia bacterium]